jgi:hypothetical protein
MVWVTFHRDFDAGPLSYGRNTNQHFVRVLDAARLPGSIRGAPVATSRARADRIKSRVIPESRLR